MRGSGSGRKRAHLITHARYNGRVPVGSQARDRFQGERASGSYKSDDIVLEMHIRSESWRTSTRAGGVATQSGETNNLRKTNVKMQGAGAEGWHGSWLGLGSR